MQKLLVIATIAATIIGAVAPAQALNLGAGLYDAAMVDSFDRRGRRPRVPGGSGCDDPEDIIEHPECTPG